MDLKSMAHILDVSTHLISQWSFNVSIYGDVVLPRSPLKGCPGVCKLSTLDILPKFLIENPTAYLKEVHFWLCVEEGILISTSSIHRYRKYVLDFTNKCVTGKAIERNDKEHIWWYDEAQGMVYDFQILCVMNAVLVWVDWTVSEMIFLSQLGHNCFISFANTSLWGLPSLTLLRSQIIHTSGDKSSSSSPSSSPSALSPTPSSSCSSPSAFPCVPATAWVGGVGSCKEEAD